MRVLVLGGTGVAGSLTVAELRRRGHEVRILSRKAGAVEGGVAGDLLTGDGLAAALSGVDTVVDTSNFATMNYEKAAGMFEASMRRIGELAPAAGPASTASASAAATSLVATGWVRIAGTSAIGPNRNWPRICAGKSWNWVARTTVAGSGPPSAARSWRSFAA